MGQQRRRSQAQRHGPGPQLVYSWADETKFGPVPAHDECPSSESPSCRDFALGNVERALTKHLLSISDSALVRAVPSTVLRQVMIPRLHPMAIEEIHSAVNDAGKQMGNILYDHDGTRHRQTMRYFLQV
jgi:hypothetical protein